MRFEIIKALTFAAGLFAMQAAHAQQPLPQPEPVEPQAAQPAPGSSFIIDPKTEIQGDQIKSETYRSQPAGKNHNWNLDIGRFQQPIEQEPSEFNNRAEDLNENYSGMRFRLPLKGGLNQ